MWGGGGGGGGWTGNDFLSDVHFADLVYFGSAHSTYCACANAMCFLRVWRELFNMSIMGRFTVLSTKLLPSSIAGHAEARSFWLFSTIW